MRLGDWKLIEYFENNDIELYNLKEDLGEKNDLIDKFPEIAKVAPNDGFINMITVFISNFILTHCLSPQIQAG